MADFVVNPTDAAVLDADEVTIYSNQLILAATPELVADQAVTVRDSGAAKIFQFAKYANLAAPSALSDGVDPDSTLLADSVATLTPVEEGLAVTLARIADLQAGLKAGLAAAQLVGRNAGNTSDLRAIAALEAATTNLIYPNAATSTATVGSGDILDSVFAGRLYNKLARANVPGIGSSYLGIAHDDCLYDLRQDSSNGGWTDVSKYADPNSVLRNEVGMFKGIRWLRSGNVTVDTDAGAGAVDTYEVQVVGFNALGYASSQAVQLMITGPFDKLRRFLNFGWYGVFKYGTIDEANMVSGVCASSIGAN